MTVYFVKTIATKANTQLGRDATMGAGAEEQRAGPLRWLPNESLLANGSYSSYWRCTPVATCWQPVGRPRSSHRTTEAAAQPARDGQGLGCEPPDRSWKAAAGAVDSARRAPLATPE